MKLYSPEDGVQVNANKEQAEIMIEAGWTKTPPQKEAVEAPDENPEVKAAKPKPTPIGKKKRIAKTEE